MRKLRLLRWGGYPGLSRWTSYNQKGPHKREARAPGDERSQVLRNGKQLLETGKEMGSSQGTQSCQDLDFSPVRPISEF